MYDSRKWNLPLRYCHRFRWDDIFAKYECRFGRDASAARKRIFAARSFARRGTALIEIRWEHIVYVRNALLNDTYFFARSALEPGTNRLHASIDYLKVFGERRDFTVAAKPSSLSTRYKYTIEFAIGKRR